MVRNWRHAESAAAWRAWRAAARAWRAAAVAWAHRRRRALLAGLACWATSAQNLRYANPIARFEHLVSTYQLQNRFAFVHTHVVSRLTQTQADGGQWLALAVAARAKD